MLTLVQLEVFLLIMARIAGMMVRAPVISGRGIPALARMSIVIFLTIILWFIVPLPRQLPDNFFTFFVALVNEVLLGFLIGFVCFLTVAIFQVIGEIMDLQMGLSISKTLDPAFGTEISLIGRFAYLYGVSLFLMANGHHLMLAGLNSSFSLFPIAGGVNYSGGFLFQLVKLISNLWLVAIQLSAPVLLSIFLADFTFGMVSRVAPQVNVFMLGFQVKPLIGIFIFLAVLPIFTNRLISLVNQILPQLFLIFGFLK